MTVYRIFNYPVNYPDTNIIHYPIYPWLEFGNCHAKFNWGNLGMGVRSLAGGPPSITRSLYVTVVESKVAHTVTHQKIRLIRRCVWPQSHNLRTWWFT